MAVSSVRGSSPGAPTNKTTACLFLGISGESGGRGAMAKQLNGIFREWTRVKQADESAPPIIWGYCIVHLSHPEFCGNVLHTSGVLSIAEHKTLLIAETRNNYYALLGPELVMPADCKVDPETFVTQQRAETRKTDVYVSAAMNADRDCP